MRKQIDLVDEYNQKNVKDYKSAYDVGFDKTKEECDALFRKLQDLFRPLDLDYSHQIGELPEETQNAAFVTRAELVYKLLVLAFLLLTDKNMYRLEYSAESPIAAFTVEELKKGNYVLGIFGSNEATSDIDVGVRYAGNGDAVALHHVVRVMEDVYVHLGKRNNKPINSLSLDVEFYGNTETVQAYGVENFFMSTASFEQADFKKVLPYAWASIVRNEATALYSNCNECGAECEQCCARCLDELEKSTPTISEKDFSGFLKVVGSEPVHDADSIQQAKTMVKGYLGLTYEKGREKYYDRIKASETHLMKVIKPNVDHLSTAQIVEAMILSADALLYRKESYLLGSTILHVVRVMQGNATDDPSKCGTQKSPICSIGRYGFILSLLEQIGYMKRFQQTYCYKEHSNTVKCAAKLAKYKLRYDDAMKRLAPAYQTKFLQARPASAPAPPLAPPALAPPAPKKRFFGLFGGRSRKKKSLKRKSKRRKMKRF